MPEMTALVARLVGPQEALVIRYYFLPTPNRAKIAVLLADGRGRDAEVLDDLLAGETLRTKGFDLLQDSCQSGATHPVRAQRAILKTEPALGPEPFEPFPDSQRAGAGSSYGGLRYLPARYPHAIDAGREALSSEPRNSAAEAIASGLTMRPRVGHLREYGAGPVGLLP